MRANSCRKSHPSIMTTTTSSMTYRDAGADIDAGDALLERIEPAAKRTMRPEVLVGFVA